MSEPTAGQPPVARLDPAALVAEVNRRTDLGLRLTGRAEQGEVGAGYVELTDGTPAVLTVADASLGELRTTGDILTRIATAGVPAPTYLAIVDLGERRAIVQQRLPGRAPERFDGALVEQIIGLVDRLAGLGEAAAAVNLYLTSSGPGFCVHETLATFDDRSRRLLDRIHEIGAASAALESGTDLVHLDLHPGNLLVDQPADGVPGRHQVISGLVDWDGIGRGDRRFCLVTLGFGLSSRMRFRVGIDGLGPDDLEPVLSRLAEAPSGRVRAWWASMSLRLVDWTIRHGYPTATVDFYLALAGRGLDELERGPLSVGTLLPGR